MRTIEIKQVSSHGAIDIGLSCLGCISGDGEPACQSYLDNTCTGAKSGKCMRAAMEEHSEAQAEIVLASIAIMARNAKSSSALRAALPKVERIIEATAAC